MFDVFISVYVFMYTLNLVDVGDFSLTSRGIYLGSHESSDNKVISNFYIHHLHLIIIIKIIFLRKTALMYLLLINVLLQQLKSSHAAGPDGVPSNILKRHSQLFSIPLTYLFNKSIKSGYFRLLLETIIYNSII